MRYFLVNYYQKPNGKMDENTMIAKRVKSRDWQTAAVILDFKDCKVLKANLAGATVPKDFQKIVSFYHQYYPNVIERLFQENGYETSVEKPGTSDTD
jgi:hypothetical protein